MNRRSRRSTPKGSDAEHVVESHDGVLTFRLTCGNSGVYVERVQRRGTGTLSHSAMFFTRDDFASFCDTDELRFEYQLAYIQLRKTFEELFDAVVGTPAPQPERDRP
jgi:hypothetical protein